MVQGKIELDEVGMDVHVIMDDKKGYGKFVKLFFKLADEKECLVYAESFFDDMEEKCFLKEDKDSADIIKRLEKFGIKFNEECKALVRVNVIDKVVDEFIEISRGFRDFYYIGKDFTIIQYHEGFFLIEPRSRYHEGYLLVRPKIKNKKEYKKEVVKLWELAGKVLDVMKERNSK